MPGPFPGMDPWLEDEDVFPALHERLVVYLSESLNATLPPGYVATTKNRVWVDDTSTREPDVALFGRGAPSDRTAGHAAVLPGLIAVGQELTQEPWEEPYLEIRSNRGKRLVTAVEVLSRSNKRAGSRGRKTYQDKQEEFRLSGVNLVEIDLLRAGPHTTAVPESSLRQAAGPFDYHVSVLVAGSPNQYHVAGIRLTDRLPVIGLPLDPGVPAVTVDLQAMIDRAHDTSRYTELVDYSRPADPPLTPEQQAWAEGILQAKGLIAPQEKR